MPRKKQSNDPAHRETDKIIADLEKKLKSTYSRAAQETQEKLDKYLSAFARKDEAKRKLLDAGEITKQEYDKWRTGQIMIGKRWEEMRDSLAQDMLNTEKLASQIIQTGRADAYALNHNYATFEVEKSSLVDTSYTLYDRKTVERLIKDEPTLLPALNPRGKTAREIREGKILRWNQKHITAEVTQGILQGESVDKIARRMRNVASMDYSASVRNARTAITGAQNAGRQAGYERAEEMGIKGKKQWLATMDSRTRHWHVELDGVSVETDEDFENEYGKIEYPGDPSADPANVYNCRCTMIYVLDGLDDSKREWFESRSNEALGDITWEEWKEQHAER